MTTKHYTSVWWHTMDCHNVLYHEADTLAAAMDICAKVNNKDKYKSRQPFRVEEVVTRTKVTRTEVLTIMQPLQPQLDV